MTKQENFEIQQLLANVYFGLNNWVGNLQRIIPEGVYGSIHPMNKSEILQDMKTLVDRLGQKSREMREERESKTLNDVTSFFYYMWNAWNEDECKIVFTENWEHFWNKWCHHAKRDIYGSTENFYSDLSNYNKDRLVARATEVYEGMHRKTI